MSEWKETDIGLIPKDWQYVPFQSVLLQPLRNGIYKSKEYHGRGTRVVNMGEIFSFDKLPCVEMSRIELDKDEFEKSSVIEGDLLFARRSLVAEGAGKCTLVLSQNEPLTFESSIIRARPNPKKTDSAYLLYLFSSRIGKYLLRTILRQVAVSGITGTDLAKLNLPLPVLEEQKSVSNLLSSLDRKIENLRNQNETLEKIAQTLFKHWFVDFEFPYDFAQGRPNADGKPYKSSGGEMMPSELGEIPVGWRVGKLGDVTTTITKGTTPTTLKRQFQESGINFLKAESITDQHSIDSSKLAYIDEETNQLLRRSILQEKDVVYTIAGTIGRYAMVGKSLLPANTNQAVAIIRPNIEKVDPEYILCYFSSRSYQYYLSSRVVQAVQANLSLAILGESPIIIPSTQIRKSFGELIKPLVRKKEQNQEQIQTLTQTRDALLPKLMSGQLRIKP
ncbi:restriction endonuclease subunit S [Spirulina subsalsa FACHB-351]|uniref:Restriction endonuclease subunit S n=1 Tax=Spirulina subsalsa FACHB-351 TaxID=234711 RepID=A0ABT3LB86_9CYAN|nr:restriction endonuclease subunit S [Spirulina subsalsa]MCW6038780.1 restriction endonuclease subunit S [Spirulina subsalsa FACHB-351]